MKGLTQCWTHNVPPHNSLQNKMLSLPCVSYSKANFGKKKGLGRFLKLDHFITYVFSKWVIIQQNFQICWSPILEIEISCQWEWSACTQSALIFYFKFCGDGGRNFFIFPLFPSCSHQVLKVFPDAFPTLFPIALGFYAI